MPNIPPLIPDQHNLNDWTDQVTLELNEANDTIIALQEALAALTARVVALEP